MKTFNGPVQLLHVIVCSTPSFSFYHYIYYILTTFNVFANGSWLYSRMAIGGLIFIRGDWRSDFEFPTLPMWVRRMKGNKGNSNIVSAHKELDNMLPNKVRV